MELTNWGELITSCSSSLADLIHATSWYYRAFDHKVHVDPRPFYVDNWLWDTFRALEPLQTLLNPDVQADKIQSYVRMYQQSGIMPTFAIASGNMPCMNGNHAAPWFADAWFKGIHNFDLETAYQGVRKRSLEDTLLPWRLAPRFRSTTSTPRAVTCLRFAPVKKKPIRACIRLKDASPFPSLLKTASTTGRSRSWRAC
jgi:glycosyl hydrolase family 92